MKLVSSIPTMRVTTVKQLAAAIRSVADSNLDAINIEWWREGGISRYSLMPNKIREGFNGDANAVERHYERMAKRALRIKAGARA